jgi:hypothetical protein
MISNSDALLLTMDAFCRRRAFYHILILCDLASRCS